MAVAYYFAMAGNNFRAVAGGVQDGWQGHDTHQDPEEPVCTDGGSRRVGYGWGPQLHSLRDQAVLQAVGHQAQAVSSPLSTIEWEGGGCREDRQEVALQQHRE